MLLSIVRSALSGRWWQSLVMLVMGKSVRFCQFTEKRRWWLPLILMEQDTKGNMRERFVTQDKSLYMKTWVRLELVFI